MDKYDTCNIWPEIMSLSDLYDLACRIYDKGQEQFKNAMSEDLTGILLGMQEERDWRRLRARLETLSFYSKTASIKNQEILLDFFFHLLFHDNGTIRELAAKNTALLMPEMIIRDKTYISSALRRILFLSGEKSEGKRRMAGSALSVILADLVKVLSDQEINSVLMAVATYFKSFGWDRITCLNLLQAVMNLPCRLWNMIQKKTIIDFCRYAIDGEDPELRTAGLLLIRNWLTESWKCPDDFKNYLRNIRVDHQTCQVYLLKEIRKLLGDDVSKSNYLYEILFQENLQSDHNWVKKIVNLEILDRIYMKKQIHAEEFKTNSEKDISLYASHLLHLLRLNTKPEVFKKAGDALVDIMPDLKEVQRYQIILEILKAIELKDDSTNYIPSFLGKTFFTLGRHGLEDLYLKMKELSDRKNADIVKIIIETACVILDLIPENTGERPKPGEYYHDMEEKLLGILGRGLASYRKDVSDECFILTGKYIFKQENRLDDPGNKIDLLRKMLGSHKKLLQSACDSVFLPALWNMVGYLQELTASDMTESKKPAAIISGSFDPFTLEDKALARDIAELGCTVYINIIDYPSKPACFPIMLRRKAAEMTTADLHDVYLLSAEFPVNIQNPADILTLSEYLGDREIVLYTDSYFEEPSGLSQTIHYRKLPSYLARGESGYTEGRKNSPFDLMNHLDNLASNLILEHMPVGGIRRYESRSEPGRISFREIRKSPGSEHGHSEYNWIFMEKQNQENIILGSISWYEEIERIRQSVDEETARLLSLKGLDSCARITRIIADGADSMNHRFYLLNECLQRLQERGINYAVICQEDINRQLVSSFGFKAISASCMGVDLSQPLVLFLDQELAIREEYRQRPTVRKTLASSRNRLLQSLSALYPGNVILYLESGRLMDQVEQLIEKESDGKLFVPLGSILRKIKHQNTDTYPLYLEKQYTADMESFTIREIPMFPNIRAQIRALKSLDRSFVLVDDLYHKGHRIRKLKELMKEENLTPDSILVGMQSEKGRLLAEETGIMMDSIYQIPGLRAWLVESELYPFIGGDGLERDNSSDDYREGIPSVNGILPYLIPGWLKDADPKAIYNLSMTCLTNVKEIFLVLEREYLNTKHQVLTLERLKEVMTEARFPADINLSDNAVELLVSELTVSEMQRLRRIFGRYVEEKTDE